VRRTYGPNQGNLSIQKPRNIISRWSARTPYPRTSHCTPHLCSMASKLF